MTRTAVSTSGAVASRRRAARPGARTMRSTGTEAPQDVVDGLGLELVRHGVGDEPRGAGGDLLALDQAVLPQRGAGRREVDDALSQPGQRRQLDRALDLDDLRLAARALEVA